VDALDNYGAMAEVQVIKTIGARNRQGTDDYRRFLVSADLVSVDGQLWSPKDKARTLAIALRNEDADVVRRILLDAPSFKRFADSLAELKIGEPWVPREFLRTESTYRTLGEVTRMCARIFGEGLFSTPLVPDAEKFAPIAIQRFHDLDSGDGLVAVGAWLEALVREDGIHPEVARARLNEASAKKLLQRSTEGSTTEVRFDDHVLDVLRAQSGKPVVVQIHLYRGDYLIPGKSSTSLRISGREL
jgi:hypothetical protein